MKGAGCNTARTVTATKGQSTIGPKSNSSAAAIRYCGRNVTKTARTAPAPPKRRGFMASAPLQSDWTRFKEELAAMRKNWGFLLAIGITQVVLGLIALSLPLLFTLGTMLFFGLLLVVAGVVDIGSA